MMYFGLYIIGVALAYGRVNAIFHDYSKMYVASKEDFRMIQGTINLLSLFSWLSFLIFTANYFRIGRKREERFFEFKKV